MPSQALPVYPIDATCGRLAIGTTVANHTVAGIQKIIPIVPAFLSYFGQIFAVTSWTLVLA